MGFQYMNMKKQSTFETDPYDYNSEKILAGGNLSLYFSK